jgi:hypothetical protein
MNVDPLIWFQERELPFVPNHFIKCPTPTTNKSREWITNKITGRFCFSETNSSDDFVTMISLIRFVYFENERDAMLYELIWAGSSE